MKRKSFVFLMMSSFLLSLLSGTSGCRPSERPPEPWVPVLEDTSFSYLKDSVSEAVATLEEARKRIRDGEQGSEALLQPAIDSLLKLRLYYVPMTEVRQLVYDADRLFYLKQGQQAQERLNRASEMLVSIATADGLHLEESVNELISMIDDLVVNIQESSASASEKLRDVGHRVNFMCLKGELVLSGDEFQYGD